MDTALVTALAVAATLGAMLALDVAVAAVRARHLLRRHMDRPLRIIASSTICATLVLGVARSGAATTPPPVVRLAGSPVATSADTIAPASGEPSTHEVRPGDSLWKIARGALAARGLGTSGREIADYWPTIYEANREVIGSDPDLIHPGQVLVLPIPAGATTEAVPHGA